MDNSSFRMGPAVEHVAILQEMYYALGILSVSGVPTLPISYSAFFNLLRILKDWMALPEPIEEGWLRVLERCLWIKFLDPFQFYASYNDGFELLLHRFPPPRIQASYAQQRGSRGSWLLTTYQLASFYPHQDHHLPTFGPAPPRPWRPVTPPVFPPLAAALPIRDRLLPESARVDADAEADVGGRAEADVGGRADSDTDPDADPDVDMNEPDAGAS
ncbi:hypothetical protein PVAG01_10413 [Phlyctema vagabunda]|uniref:Uncharacterized protein n=1 Tax=Phlyctema vagabunda TaxID=108571 RepID=A0ABR4P5V1_9HELO